MTSEGDADVAGFAKFIAERAENLAIVHLTRRSGLLLDRIRAVHGFNLLVMLPRQQVPTGRVFGIQVHGQDQVFDPANSNQIQLYYLPELPFPLCVFAFSMTDDRGYYRWLQFPRFHTAQPSSSFGDWYPLDAKATDHIIVQVNAWYDAQDDD